ncbi:MAG: hypothetical protein MZV64_01850 [Ignavibacteriales bacterium]|nr:hypothetical protein [Ignavibacteriales bacterium]
MRIEMKKIFFILSITFLFVTKIFGQAQIDIPLIVTDGTININLALGLDLTATNCIDPQLGESDLPPVPPTGMFDVRFDLMAIWLWTSLYLIRITEPRVIHRHFHLQE